MATDLQQMINNLLDFYDFTDKTVLSIGAGGGQFYEYAFKTKHIIAVDNDKAALESLRDVLEQENLLKKFTLIHSDFYEIKEKADLLMFDFCLHEIPDPEKAIQHAKNLSPDILINDHFPGSEWAFMADEDEKVKNSWAAINKFKMRKQQRYDTVQFFHTYDELYHKVKSQGENSIKRIEPYNGKTDFTIPMSYGLVLI